MKIRRPNQTKKLIEYSSLIQNKKRLTNEETDDEVDKKAHFEWLGLKQKIMNSQA